MNDKTIESLGVLVTSHPMQHRWMHQAFASWAGFGGPLVLGYDHTDTEELPVGDFTPPVTETFVTGHPAGTLGHYRGELWQLKLGGRILADRGCRYLYKTAADNTCYRWRNLAALVGLLEKQKADIMLCGTTQILAKIEPFNEAMSLWSEQITRCGGAECFIHGRIKQLQLKADFRKIPFWGEQLGLIHLQGEWAVNNGYSIFESWIVGRCWGRARRHIDLDPRLEFFKPELREHYEHSVRQTQTSP